MGRGWKPQSGTQSSHSEGRIPAHLSRLDLGGGATPGGGRGLFLGAAPGGTTAHVRATAPGLRTIPLLSTAVVLLLIAAGVVAVLGSGGTSPQTGVLDAVNTALSDNTAHVNVEESLSGPATVQVTGSGDVNFTQNAMQLEATVTSGSQSEAFDYVYLSDMVYAHVPGIEQLLPGKSWVSIDLSQLAQAAGVNGNLGGLGSNPVSVLHLLVAQGNTVTPIGSSTIEGTTVQGYAIDFSPSVINAALESPSLPAWMRLVQQGVHLESMTSNVYVDGSGNLRRTTNQVTETVDSVTATIRGEADYSDFGQTVAISAPPDTDVATFQQLLEAAGNSISTSLSS
jgi:hypothetical protein